jgi:hypothetical protein
MIAAAAAVAPATIGFALTHPVRLVTQPLTASAIVLKPVPVAMATSTTWCAWPMKALHERLASLQRAEELDRLHAQLLRRETGTEGSVAEVAEILRRCVDVRR